MRLSNLYTEANEISRRSFLKMFGKGAAAAAGAPLEKIGNIAAKLVSEPAKKYIVYSSGYANAGKCRNEAKLLSNHFAGVWDLYQSFVKLVGSKGLFTADDDFYRHSSLGKHVGADDVSSILQKLRSEGYEITKVDLGSGVGDEGLGWLARRGPRDRWQFNNEILISDKEIHWDEKPMDSHPIIHFMKNNFMKKRTSQIEIDSQAKDYLEQIGFNQEDLNQAKQSMDAAENYEQERAKRRQASDKKREEKQQLITRRSTNPGREFGHEKRNRFDAESSKPTQELGQFESKLRMKLRCIRSS